MATFDHINVRVNDLNASVRFYTAVLGFAAAGTEGPFTLVTVGRDCQLQLAPAGNTGGEHYAFAVTRTEFEQTFARLKAARIAFGPTFDSVGTNTGPGEESGARGVAPTLCFNDPNGASAGDQIL